MRTPLLTALLFLVALTVPLSAWAQDPTPGPVAPDGATVAQDLMELIVDPTRVATQQMPLAVPDTLNLGASDPDGLSTSIAETIRRSLEMSGYFEIYGPDRYFFDANSEGMTPGTIRFENWYNVGAQGLIKTGFRVEGDQVALDFRVYSVDTESQLNIGWEAVTVPEREVRSQVYDFINKVILYFSGEPGIFGSRITYVAPDRHGVDQIWTSNMDGTGAHQVTDNASINMLPSWGWDGQMLYTSFQAGNPDLWIGDQILSNRPGLNMGASLHPDGEQIAVTLSMEGDSEIYIIDRQGEILRQCTDNLAEDVSPTWSAGGSRIAFVSDRSGNPQIYVMNADCTNQRRVTFAGNYNTTPDWSPDSSVIAFTGRDSRNRFDIFTVEVGSGFITRVTQDQGNNEEPTWSPDGRYLIFQSDRGGGGTRLYISTADGEFQTVITENGSGYEQPAWHR